MLKVNEIFPSIQGESTLQGIPTVFIRLSGCNLNCSYCDTVYAKEKGDELTIDEIQRKAEQFGLKYACITGGEPLLQKETNDLAVRLINKGYTVSVETNGSFDAAVLDKNIIRIIDVKCPGSGEHESICINNVLFPRKTDEFKFVLKDRKDFDYACDFIKKYNIFETVAVLFSPVHGFLEPKTLSEWIIKEMPCVRLNLQIHKYIWTGCSEKNNIELF